MDPENFNFPYTSTDLTEQVNRIPNSFGLLQAMGLFSSEGIASTVVEVRMEDGILRVLPAKERGAPAAEGGREPGKTLFFKVPHFPHKDTILPQDIQNMLVLVARSKQPETVDNLMAKRLNTLRNNHAITREYLRMGALKGLIKDGDGTTVYNLFTEFNIVKKEVDFLLGTAGTKVIDKCEEVYDHVLKNLKGEVSSGVAVIVSSGFFSALVQHANVKVHWQNFQISNGPGAWSVANMNRDTRGGNWGRTFEFGNLRFLEYKGTFPVKANAQSALASVDAVAAGYGHAFPLGTMNTFNTFDAPADTMDAANKPGNEVFISPKELDHNKGVELWTESNPLAICKRPEVLVEVRTSN
jgi:hypothetical protein